MKKRFLSIYLILLITLIPINQAAIPYKQSLTINNYKINKVECSNNYLRVLVESKTSSTLKLVFTIHSKTSEKIFTNQLLKAFESNYYLITTNKQCSDLKRLEVNGYLTTEDTIIYLNSESSYKFTGKESSITTITEQITSTETTQTTQQITPTKYSYVYLNNKLLERINLGNNDVNYFHQDHLGSNRVITDNNGNILSKNEYTPFGNELSFSSKSNYKFTGKEQDKTNLYYFGARYYDSSIGRFTSVDPSFESTETPYSYVDNNPVRYMDIEGEAVFIPPVVWGIAAALTRYSYSLATDPTNQIDLDDLRKGWNSRDYWTVSFALLGLASAGGSGRGARESLENADDTLGKATLLRRLFESISYSRDKNIKVTIDRIDISKGRIFYAEKSSKGETRHFIETIGIGGRRIRITSNIKDKRLIDIAEESTKNNPKLQREMDWLEQMLLMGHTELGHGSKLILKKSGRSIGIHELRGNLGARLYYREIERGYEIVGKSSAHNTLHERAIKILIEIYGK